MKFHLLLLGCWLLHAPVCFSQTDFSRWTADTSIGDVRIHMLRVPADQAEDRVRTFVQETQYTLDESFKSYLAGRPTFTANSALGAIRMIELLAPNWPVNYYREEVTAYGQYTAALTKRHRDSVATAFQHRQAVSDSLRVARQAQGYLFISKPWTILKQFPNDKGMILGKVYQGTYVKIPLWYTPAANAHYIYCELGDADQVYGYIDVNDKADQLSQLNVSDSLMALLKAQVYIHFEPSPEYKAELAKEAKEDAEDAAETRSSRVRQKVKRVYITGPRGGCYYMDANGNKVYVDHSYCN